MSTHYRLQFPEPSIDFKHEIVQVSTPVPGEGQILIKNKAVAINPGDWKRIVHNVRVASWPTSGGFDVAGVIHAVGAGVDNFKPGDEVVAMVGQTESGLPSFAFQEYTLTKASNAVRKPNNLSFEEAASLPIITVTATGVLSMGLGTPLSYFKHSAAPASMSTVLVLGGSSGVGAQAIQLLHKHSPEITILATASPQNFDLVKSVGASHVFSYRDPDIIDQIHAIAPELNTIVDFLGSLQQDARLLKLLEGAQQPKIVATLALGPPTKIEVPHGVELRQDLGMINVVMNGGVHDTLQFIADATEKGDCKLPVPVNILGKGLETILEGYKVQEKGVSTQKVVVSL